MSRHRLSPSFASAWLIIAAVCCTAPTVRADLKPTTTPPGNASPATAPAIEIKVTYDVSDAPDLEDWAKKAAAYGEHWYPVIVDRLYEEGFTSPTRVKLVFSNSYKGVAATSGNEITLSNDYVRAHLDDIGVIAHEMTHVVQNYRVNNRGGGWLTEGIADYIRYYVVEPGSPRANFSFRRSNWNSPYQPSAAFLNYLEIIYPEKHVVSTLNIAMRHGKYREAMFEELTGKQPDDLWKDFKESRLKKKK